MLDSKRDTDVKNRLLDSVGEGEGRMIWENGIETFIKVSTKSVHTYTQWSITQPFKRIHLNQF